MKEESRGAQVQTMEFMGRDYELDSVHGCCRAAENRRKELGTDEAIMDNKSSWRVWKPMEV